MKQRTDPVVECERLRGKLEEAEYRLAEANARIKSQDVYIESQKATITFLMDERKELLRAYRGFHTELRAEFAVLTSRVVQAVQGAVNHVQH